MKIGILGLLFEQFQQVKQRVNGRHCDLVFINKEHNPSALPPSVNYCIVQKHVSHKWFDQAQGSVGAERTCGRGDQRRAAEGERSLGESALT